MTSAEPLGSPFKGLAAFDESDIDASLFFGRERETEIIAANLIASRLTVLFGPTGVGKTSVLRAGVAHRLKREAGIRVCFFSSWPDDPRVGVASALGYPEQALPDALASAAAEAGGQVCLILDQFEEYFLYHEDGQSFAWELADVTTRRGLAVNVLVGIREDSLALLETFKAQMPDVLSNRLRLARLDRMGGESAIVGPLRRFNELAGDSDDFQIEPQLVEAVLDEVAVGRVELQPAGRGVSGNRPASLRIEAPYLQLVMSRIWEVETGRGSTVLHLATLGELGGAVQIVRDHLDRSMAALSPGEKDVAAAMYNFLVTPSGSKIAHGADDLAGYSGVSQEEATVVLRRLSSERILRASAENGGGTRYEIFHDVLADAVVAWRNRYEGERALRASEHRRRRAVAIAAAALAALVLVGALALFALVERSHSRSDARRARARELAADADGQLTNDPQRALELALRSVALEPRPHEEDTLRAALLAANEVAVMRATGPMRVAHFDPSGNRVVTGSRDGSVRIYRTGDSRPEKVLFQGGPVTAAVYSGDGRFILTAGRNGTARLWTAHGKIRWTVGAGGPVRAAFFAGRAGNVVTVADGGVIRLWRHDGQRLREIRVKGAALVRRAVADPSGRMLATAGQDRIARVYSFASGEVVLRFRHDGFVHCVSFSPRGDMLLTCGHEGRARVWSIASGRLVKNLRGPGPRSPVLDGVFAPNGVLAAAGVADDTARVWEAPTGLQTGLMFGHTSPVTHVAFSRDSLYLATAGLDNTARTWVVNGRQVAVLSGHTGPLNGVEFSPDGARVLTASEDGTARLWDSHTTPELKRLVGQAPITAFATSPDGRRLVVGDATGVAHVRDVARGRILESRHVNGPVSAVVFGPRGPIVATRPTLSLAVSGLQIATGKSDGSVVIESPRRRRRIVTGTRPVTAVALSTDGTRLATGDVDGVVALWDIKTRRKVWRMKKHKLRITSVSFSPDARRLLTASRDHDVRVWKTSSGASRGLLRWHVGPVGEAAFSRDGRWILTAGPGSAGIGRDISSSRPTLLLRGPPTMRPLVGAAFGGTDGRTVVAASADGTIRVYRCDLCGDLRELVALARRRLDGR